MKANRQQIGRQGEEIAVRHLLAKGYEILERNFRTRYGEIDIVARVNGIMVFVEVRSRTSLVRGTGLESVDVHKQQQVRQMGNWYLQLHRLYDVPVRFDVISVLFIEPMRIDHVENAF